MNGHGMRQFVCLCLLVVSPGCGPTRLPAATLLVAQPPSPTRWDFDDSAAGTLPRHWFVAQTNPGPAPAHWEVRQMPNAPSPPHVLSLLHSDNHHATYNLMIARNTRYGDLQLSVQVQANGGREDQGGGPLWRCRNPDNYYVCRLNPLESNFRVYKVLNGERTMLASADVATVTGVWYTVEVTMRGSRIVCALDGKPLLEVIDASLPHPGMIGLWTKADAVSSFDDLAVRSLPPT